MTSWAARGFLTDLSAKAQADKVTQDKFIKEGWLEATYKNKLYAVPFDTDLRALYDGLAVRGLVRYVAWRPLLHLSRSA